MEFLINMDQPFSYNVTMTSELKNLLNDLSDKRNIDIKEIPLQGGFAVVNVCNDAEIADIVSCHVVPPVGIYASRIQSSTATICPWSR